MKNSALENEQAIPLSFRQPSYTSLHEGDLITKSGNRVSDFTTVDGEENPHVAKFKEMSDKNRERWAKIGYVPPNKFMEFAKNLNNQPKQNPNSIGEMDIGDTVVKTTHQRCGSFGMELGEAKNKQRISREILNVDDDDNYYEEEEEEESDSALQKNDSDDSECKPEMNEDNSSSQSEYESNYEEECCELFGRLGIIVKESRESSIYKAIQTGDLSYIKNVQNALRTLRKYREVCIQNLWVEENSYLNEIISGLERPIEENIPQINENNNYKKQIQFEKEKLKIATEILNRKYQEEVKQLDEKYTSPQILSKFSKPSQTLLKLKENARRLLKENKVDEAKSEIKKVTKLEQKEAKEMTHLLKQTYHNEDKALKEKYIFKLTYIRKKTEIKIRKLEKEMYLVNQHSENIEMKKEFHKSNYVD